MSTITKTIVEIANTSEVSELAGDMDPEVVKERFAAFFPIVANCTYTVKITNGIKYITFAERLGTKG